MLAPPIHHTLVEIAGKLHDNQKIWSLRGVLNGETRTGWLVHDGLTKQAASY